MKPPPSATGHDGGHATSMLAGSRMKIPCRTAEVSAAGRDLRRPIPSFNVARDER